MRTAILSALLSLSTATLAQSLAGLPTCAQSAALSGVAGSGCQETDGECLCKNSGFISSLTSAIQNSCLGSDIQAACSWGNSACSAYGVSISCSGAPSDNNDAAATTSPAAAANPTSTAAPVDNNTGGAASTMAAPAGTETGAAAAGSTTGSMDSMASGSALTSLPSTLMTSTSAMNGTMSHTSMMNSTQAARTSTTSASMTSTTSSGPTSQYTGAASAAVNKHSGVIGAVAGFAFVFALF